MSSLAHGWEITRTTKTPNTLIVGRERYAAKVARTVRRGDAVRSAQSEARFLPYTLWQRVDPVSGEPVLDPDTGNPIYDLLVRRFGAHEIPPTGRRG